MSLLDLVQDAALLVGIDEPDAVMAATTDEVKQLRALAQQEGDALARSYDWRKLKVVSTITGDGTSEYFELPCDWDRQVAGDALWLTNSPHLPLQGPIADDTLLGLKAAAGDPTRPVWRYFGKNIQIWPVLGADESVSLEYRSGYWISSSDGLTVRSRWEADTDFPLVPERLVTLGVVWRWKRAKGLDYAEEFNEYQIERRKAMRADGGFRTLASTTRYRIDPIDGRKNMYSVTPA